MSTTEKDSLEFEINKAFVEYLCPHLRKTSTAIWLLKVRIGNSGGYYVMGNSLNRYSKQRKILNFSPIICNATT